MNIFRTIIKIAAALSVGILLTVPTPALAEDVSYSTFTDVSWTQLSENIWSLDYTGAKDSAGNDIPDGSADVLLISSINEDGRQEWTYTFYVEDSNLNYYVYEQMLDSKDSPLKDGYTSKGSDSTDGKAVTATPYDAGTVEGGETYTITNSLDGTDPSEKTECGSLELSKTVIINSGYAMENPDQSFTFKIQLSDTTGELSNLINGNRIFGDEENGYVSFKNGSAIVSLKNNEAKTITNIPAGLTYEVTENAVQNYTSASLNASGAIISNETSHVVFKNTTTYKEPVAKTQALYVTKESKLSNGGTDTADTTEYMLSIKITNLSVGTEITCSKGTLTADKNGVIEASAGMKNGDTIVFYDIPVGAQYRITEEGSGKITSYRITSYDGSTVTAKTDHASNAGVNRSLSTNTETVDEGENALVTFTSTSEMEELYVLPETGGAGKNNIYLMSLVLGVAATTGAITKAKRNIAVDGGDSL